MQLSPLKLWLYSGSIFFYLLTPYKASSQIVPDTSLPNNSIVSPNCTTCDITGGTTAGTNLFHSFKEFSIPTGGTANFLNAESITNIISRVTGSSQSSIDGILKANRTANVFLLNPNGIIFKENARLDVSGSFVASTASSLKFPNGEFRVDNGGSQTPLLTISVPPIALQFGSNPGSIQTESKSVSLRVKLNKTLALVGGDIELKGGNLTAPGGQIELGGVAGNNLVKLDPIDKGWELSYEGIQNFQDIKLSNGAYVSGNNVDIQIQGKRVTLTGGSQVASIASQNQAGNIKVNGSEQVELLGTPEESYQTGLFNQVKGTAQGQERVLEINTKRLIVREGAQVSTNTFGTGQGANLTVNATDSVELEGNSQKFGPSGLFARVGDGNTKGGSGNGGTLTITTGQLTVKNGAQVSTDTYGAGSAGDLIVKASSSVKLEGRSPTNKPSGLFTQVGTIGSQVTTGNAGDLTIETGKFEALGGAQISSATTSQGNGGILTIKASDSILVSGATSQATADAQDTNRSNISVRSVLGSTGNAGTINIDTGLLTVEKQARIAADTSGSGKGGTANLNVGKLVIRDRGEVRASSFGSGPAGNLNVTANEIRLNRGKLTATSKAGTEGNITLNNLKLLLMQNGSQISANASENANGGNITINAPNGLIVALPGENNDIIARAVRGDGGKINITTQSIYNFRKGGSTTENTTNDIDASSPYGLSGTVNIKTSETDPKQGLVELPTGTVDPSKLIASGCSTFDRALGNQFIITGRGGLPPSPNEPLSSNALWSDTRISKITSQGSKSVSTPIPTAVNAPAIVPATGWVFNNKGEVTLISNVSGVNPHLSGQNSASCATR